MKKINLFSWLVLILIGSAYALAGINSAPVTSTIDQSTPGVTNKVSIGTDGTVAINAAIPSGTNTIGKAGIDQSTPGTTNAVSNSYIGSTPIASGNGVSGAGVQRVVIASDQSAFSVTTSPTFGTRSDTFTGAANGTTVDTHLAPLKYFSIGCKGTGAAPTSWQVVLEGSNDNTNFTTILNHQNTVLADGQTLYSGTSATPVLYFRSRAVAVTLGSATNIVCVILGT